MVVNYAINQFITVASCLLTMCHVIPLNVLSTIHAVIEMHSVVPVIPTLRCGTWQLISKMLLRI